MTELEPTYKNPRLTIFDSFNNTELESLGDRVNKVGEQHSVFEAARLKAEAREIDRLQYSSEML